MLERSLFHPLLVLAVLTSGCADPEARFYEFLDVTKHQRPDDSSDEGESGMIIEPFGDMTGTYLFALEATTLGPDLPLQFVATIDNMIFADDGSGATADFTFQPLSLDQGQTLIPRECLDEMLTFPGVEFDADGKFEIDMGLVMVSGEANPITQTDIEATLVVTGHIVHADAFCGEIEGMLMSPLEYDLMGSNFAAIRLDDGNDGCTPETLPTSFPYKCSSVLPLP